MENSMYSFEVIGEFVSPLRGGVPASCDDLVNKESKDISTLIFKVMSAQVDNFLQIGDTASAMSAIETYVDEKVKPYANPLNTFKKNKKVNNFFKRDEQVGDAPFMGAHWLFAAIRDSAKFIFPEAFYGGGVKKAPSGNHFRKFVEVTPYHIFLHRPTYDENNENIVKEIDDIEKQQPSEKVGGFSQYEVIYTPLQFRAEVNVSPRGPFLKLLKDPDNMREIIQQARNHRLGTCRSAGYGTWDFVKLKVKEGS